MASAEEFPAAGVVGVDVFPGTWVPQPFSIKFMELKAQQHAGGASRDSHVRWGVIGCGNIAGRFARSLAHVPNASLAAVWSRRPEAVAAFARSAPEQPAGRLVGRVWAHSGS